MKTTMKTTSTKHVVVVSMVLLLTALAIQPTQLAQAADPVVKGASGSAPIGERSIRASGAAEDTLKACIARIPEVASAGQRMLAEQSCAAEEETRKTIRSAPKF
jgi:DNA-binding transcriptional regulator YdaS (Cro superfamily)